MLEIHNVTKRYGRQTAVDDLSFTVKSGIVTGFLGPNGRHHNLSPHHRHFLEPRARGRGT